MTRVLVLGRRGQLARALARAEPPPGWSLDFAGRERADLARPDRVRALVRDLAPDVIVNTAAYTAVDRAEAERDLAFAINAEGAEAAAGAAREAGALLLHLSTDYVFDGRGGAPYAEDAPVAPLQAYGASKAAGESRVLAVLPDAQVVRTSWIVSSHGPNFVTAMLARARAGQALRVVDDQRGRPTSAADLARALLAIAAARRAGRGAGGLLHVAGGGEATWFELARAAVGRALGPEAAARIEAISSRDHGAPAARPSDARLDCGRLEAAFGLALPAWRTALDEIVAELGHCHAPAAIGVESGPQSGG